MTGGRCCLAGGRWRRWRRAALRSAHAAARERLGKQWARGCGAEAAHCFRRARRGAAPRASSKILVERFLFAAAVRAPAPAPARALAPAPAPIELARRPATHARSAELLAAPLLAAGVTRPVAAGHIGRVTRNTLLCTTDARCCRAVLLRYNGRRASSGHREFYRQRHFGRGKWHPPCVAKRCRHCLYPGIHCTGHRTGVCGGAGSSLHSSPLANDRRLDRCCRAMLVVCILAPRPSRHFVLAVACVPRHCPPHRALRRRCSRPRAPLFGLVGPTQTLACVCWNSSRSRTSPIVGVALERAFTHHRAASASDAAWVAPRSQGLGERAPRF